MPGAGPAVGLGVGREEPPLVGRDVVAPEVVEVFVAVPAAEQVQRLGAAVQQHLGSHSEFCANVLCKKYGRENLPMFDLCYPPLCTMTRAGQRR